MEGIACAKAHSKGRDSEGILCGWGRSGRLPEQESGWGDH